MRVEAGKTYKTRDGRSVRILCTDANNSNQYCKVVGLVSGSINGDEHPMTWGVDGTYSRGGINPGLDLVPNKVTTYVNLRRTSGTYDMFRSPQVAKDVVKGFEDLYHAVAVPVEVEE